MKKVTYVSLFKNIHEDDPSKKKKGRKKISQISRFRVNQIQLPVDKVKYIVQKKSSKKKNKNIDDDSENESEEEEEEDEEDDEEDLNDFIEDCEEDEDDEEDRSNADYDDDEDEDVQKKKKKTSSSSPLLLKNKKKKKHVYLEEDDEDDYEEEEDDENDEDKEVDDEEDDKKEVEEGKEEGDDDEEEEEEEDDGKERDAKAAADDDDDDGAHTSRQITSMTSRNIYLHGSKRFTSPYLSKFELTRVVGERANTIENGAKPVLLQTLEDEIEALGTEGNHEKLRQYVLREISEGVCPITIYRPVKIEKRTDETLYYWEVWNVSDMKYIDERDIDITIYAT